MNKQRMQKLAGLLSESKLNEAKKSEVIDQLYDVWGQESPNIENKLSSEIEKYAEKLRKEYSAKFNSKYSTKLKALVGKVITEKDIQIADRQGLALPFYKKGAKEILNSPIKSASYIFVSEKEKTLFSGTLRLLLTFENGKQFVMQ